MAKPFAAQNASHSHARKAGRAAPAMAAAVLGITLCQLPSWRQVALRLPLAQVGMPVGTGIAMPPLVLKPLGQRPSGDFSNFATSLPKDGMDSGGLLAVPEWFRGNDVCRLVYAAREGFGKRVGELRSSSGGSNASSSVVFSVYDVGQVLPDAWHQKWQPQSSRPVDGLWHSSLKAFGHTYDNPRNVDGTLPRALSPDMRYQYVLETARTAEEFLEFFAKTKADDKWSKDNYDLRYNNCNHWMVDILQYLVGPGQESYVLSAPEFLMPNDFAKQAPPDGLGHEFNELVMKGMMKRQRVLRREGKAAQVLKTRNGNVAVTSLAVAAGLFCFYLGFVH
ncbi:unnamed protein product [Polarella glacialis]|uniref:PPPDE domain-containing protein n=1 Tax=Polarella glacialis TaxID=89957 RepID=A0A813I428_POLGL|nr:unnamed protein product [Polarella glacialis]